MISAQDLKLRILGKTEEESPVNIQQALLAYLSAKSRREGIVFVPIPWETLGGWHEQTVEQVKKLASVQARQTWRSRVKQQDISTRSSLSSWPGEMQPSC